MNYTYGSLNYVEMNKAVGTEQRVLEMNSLLKMNYRNERPIKNETWGGNEPEMNCKNELEMNGRNDVEMNRGNEPLN